MKNRPQMELLDHDGNIFAIMGRASRELKRNGMSEEATEMFARVTACHDYHEALFVISEYVQTELSEADHGILEADDIRIDPDVTIDEKGVTAYIETWFDTARRFGVALGPDDSIDLYATVQPETGGFTSSIIIKRDPGSAHECLDVKLLPCEKTIIAGQMEQSVRETENKSLKDIFVEWKQQRGEDQTHSKDKEKKAQRER